MYFGLVEALTYKSRIQQIGDGNHFILEDNEVFATASGTIIAPRFLYTDNITFVNNTFCDIRASHIHDIPCATHKIITSNLSKDSLIKMGLLYINKKATERERNFLTQLKEQGRFKGDPNVDVWVCEDIPEKYLEIKDIGFSDTNTLFKLCLKATRVKDGMANVMGAAVYTNYKWFTSKPKQLPSADRIFKDLIYT